MEVGQLNLYVKNAIITGACYDIGREFTLILAFHRAEVVVKDLDGLVSSLSKLEQIHAADALVAEIKKAGSVVEAKKDFVEFGE